MSNSLKKLKRRKEERTPAPPVNLKLLEQIAYNRGYDQGAMDQRKQDIQSVLNILDGLEDMPGIGKATANKIRYLVASKFEVKDG